MVRISTHAQLVQSNASKEFIDNRLSTARNPGATRTAKAARICAKRSPPRSRAMMPGKQNFRCSCQGREESNGLKGITKQRTRDSGDKRYQRRLVHIAPVEMLAIRDVIQFVNVIAVFSACVQVDK